MAAAAILDFWQLKKFYEEVERFESHQCAKFRQNQSISCEDVQIFQFYKMAAAAILDI